MARCYACSQENCGRRQPACQCDCHGTPTVIVDDRPAEKLKKRRNLLIEDTIQIYCEGEQIAPSTDGSAGLDLRAMNGMPRVIHPCHEQPMNSRWAIRTGVRLAMPRHYCAQVLGRSGLALDHGIIVVAGLIDSDYRGEVKVILANISHTAFTINGGERIAQLIFHPVVSARGAWMAQFEFVKSPELLGKTERGDNGFGSTGMS
jgi:dUTP pyrophosphatase